MSKNFYWGFMLYLSNHMWSDESTLPRGKYLPKPYNDEIDTEVEAWDDAIKYLSEHKYNLVLIDVGDGIKYESHPEISAPNAWDKDFLKNKLDEIRAQGMIPVPKLNFSAGHDTWLKKYRRMISTPEYYQTCSDLIKEVSEAFGYPELFHIGFDEEDAEHQVGRHEMAIIRGEDLWFHDLNYIAAECSKHGARPWIWSDYMWKHRDTFLRRMSKDIMQSNWYYGVFYDNIVDGSMFLPMIESYELLDKHGFDQIPTCSMYEFYYNIKQTLAYCKDMLSEEHLKGVMVAPWVSTNSLDSLDLKRNAQRLYLERKEYYPETL